jgi:hypothetical protein
MIDWSGKISLVFFGSFFAGSIKKELIKEVFLLTFCKTKPSSRRYLDAEFCND